jgi:hypothetical protein
MKIRGIETKYGIKKNVPHNNRKEYGRRYRIQRIKFYDDLGRLYTEKIIYHETN